MGEGRADGDEARQILVLRSQAIGNPGAHAGTDEVIAARMQLEQGAAVGGIGAVQGAQDAQVIHTLRHVGKQFADRKPAFAVVFEGPRRF